MYHIQEDFFGPNGPFKFGEQIKLHKIANVIRSMFLLKFIVTALKVFITMYMYMREVEGKEIT